MDDAKTGTLETEGLSHGQIGHSDEPRHTKTCPNQANETEGHTAQGKQPTDAAQTRTDPIRHTLEAIRGTPTPNGQTESFLEAMIIVTSNQEVSKK